MAPKSRAAPLAETWLAIAAKAHQDGHSIIAALLNEAMALALKGQVKGLGIKSADPPKGVTLQDAHLRFSKALEHVDYPPDDAPPSAAWTVGAVNGAEKGQKRDKALVRPVMIGLGGTDVHFVGNTIKFLMTAHPEWKRDQWDRYIVQPVKQLDAAWRTWFKRADKKADRRNKILPTNPAVLRLINAINSELNPDRPRTEIAREIAELTGKNPNSLLRQCRRFPHLLD